MTLQALHEAELVAAQYDATIIEQYVATTAHVMTLMGDWLEMDPTTLVDLVRNRLTLMAEGN